MVKRSRLLTPTAGTIRLDGHDLNLDPAALRARGLLAPEPSSRTARFRQHAYATRRPSRTRRPPLAGRGARVHAALPRSTQSRGRRGAQLRSASQRWRWRARVSRAYGLFRTSTSPAQRNRGPPDRRSLAPRTPAQSDVSTAAPWPARRDPCAGIGPHRREGSTTTCRAVGVYAALWRSAGKSGLSETLSAATARFFLEGRPGKEARRQALHKSCLRDTAPTPSG